MTKQKENKPQPKSMTEVLQDIAIVIDEKYKLTRSEEWRVAFLCITQGIKKIEEARISDKQRADRLRMVGSKASEIERMV